MYEDSGQRSSGMGQIWLYKGRITLNEDLLKIELSLRHRLVMYVSQVQHIAQPVLTEEFSNWVFPWLTGGTRALTADGTLRNAEQFAGM
ncbi:hypothetical protein RRG08_049248 [Elysia crispata]|uniref:Uncharacterized protein n=1 Tax=Elysia crispata TaxID=231223 RepID=A0AAE0ZP78_9GAST|nr:hypothetical protein RRG08_049248 [Elysia crispata]